MKGCVEGSEEKRSIKDTEAEENAMVEEKWGRERER